MIKLLTWLPLMAVAGLLAACQTEPAEQSDATEEATAPDAATVRTEIEAINDRFEQALLAEDPVTIATTYTEDAVVLPPGAARAKGPGAIQSMFASWFEQVPPTEGFTLTTDDLRLADSGDLAYEVGTYTMRGTSPAGEGYDETGKYLVVWRNVGGEWKIAADSWSGDAPMHTGESAETSATTAGATESAQPDAE